MYRVEYLYRCSFFYLDLNLGQKYLFVLKLLTNFVFIMFNLNYAKKINLF